MGVARRSRHGIVSYRAHHQRSAYRREEAGDKAVADRFFSSRPLLFLQMCPYQPFVSQRDNDCANSGYVGRNRVTIHLGRQQPRGGEATERFRRQNASQMADLPFPDSGDWGKAARFSWRVLLRRRVTAAVCATDAAGQ